MRFLIGLLLTGSLVGQNVIKISELKSLIHSSNDSTYVINFWATWCGPCVEELPHFERLHETFKDRPVRVVLVSLDFKSQLETRVKPFVIKNRLHSTVLLLDETDANSYIDQVNTQWSGAIPATLVVHSKTGVRSFYEKQMTFQELVSIVEPLLQ